MRLKFVLQKSKRSMSIGTFMFLLLVTFISPVAGSEQMPILSIHVNGSIRDALHAIEKKSNFVFIYSDDISKDLNEKVVLKADHERLDRILDKILTPRNLSYRVHERQISILKSSHFQQPHKSKPATLKIAGRVVDEKGESLIGVSVQET